MIVFQILFYSQKLLVIDLKSLLQPFLSVYPNGPIRGLYSLYLRSTTLGTRLGRSAETMSAGYCLWRIQTPGQCGNILCKHYKNPIFSDLDLHICSQHLLRWHQFYIPRDPSVGLPRRPHDVRYWMDIHARYPSNMSDLYHDNCSQVSYTEWWADPYRHTYVIEDPCVAFDAYWRPFTDLVLKNWFGVSCQNGHYFICIKLMDGMT